MALSVAPGADTSAGQANLGTEIMATKDEPVVTTDVSPIRRAVSIDAINRR